MNYACEYWLSEDERSCVYSSDYWTNESHEEDKPWDVRDGDFDKLEKHLNEVGYADDLLRCFDYVDIKSQQGGVAVDMAGGVLWAVPKLYTYASYRKIYAVELSPHRLMKIGPLVLDNYDVPYNVPVLANGSFYNLKISDNSVDLIFLSAAFHHADRPIDLLKEMRRVLKPSGCAIIVGEHIVRDSFVRPRHLWRALGSRMPDILRRAMGGYSNPTKCFAETDFFYPTDEVLGDHYYTLRDYKKMFEENGFISTCVTGKNRSFVLRLRDH